ncbi:hypothetical protein [Microbacterium lacticum]
MSKRSRAQAAPSPLLIMVRMAVADDGTLTVTVDGAEYPPPEFSPPWQRASYPALVEAISAQHPGRTLRIDIIETDGRLISDFYTPPKPRPAPVPPIRDARRAPAPKADGEPPRLVQLVGSGFVPGEDVAVAVIVAHAEANPDGTSRAVLDARSVAGNPTREVVLLGRISGTIAIGVPA